MTKHIATTLIACFICYLYSIAQPFYFRHYEVENGLSNNSVITAAQDKYGFMWFGTSDGLNRFDGNTFKIYRHSLGKKNTLQGNSIYCLHEDFQGKFWVGTEKGIFQYQAATDDFSQPIPINNGTVRSICSDDGLLWFILRDELYYYNIDKRIVRKQFIPGIKNVSVLSKSKHGGIWIGTTDGNIAQLKNNQATIYPISEKNKNTIQSILHYKDNQMLIGSSKDGLISYNISSKQRTNLINKDNTGKEIFVRNILQVSDSIFYINAENGLYIYNVAAHSFKHLIKEIGNPFSLSDNALYALCKDRQGGIWIGSYFGGINYLPKTSLTFEKFFPTLQDNTISGNAIREITQDKNGDLWIGSEDAGLTKYDPKKNSFTKFRPNDTNNLSSSNIHGLLAVNDYLLVGTFEHGLDLLNIPTGKVIKNFSMGNNTNDLSSNFINKIFLTSNGDIIICTSYSVLYFDLQKQLFYPESELPKDVFYSAITEDSNGTVWIGTHNKGVFYLNNEHAGPLKLSTNINTRLSNTRILYLMAEGPNLLWVCTINGLYLINLKDQTFKHYSEATGLPSNIVYSIIQDDSKNYWIPTSQGLVYMKKATGNITVFRQHNGLLNNQFNYQSVFKDPKGNIYLGSIKGLIKFNPSSLHSSLYIPPLYITNLQHPGVNLERSENGNIRPLLTTRQVQLRHDQATFNLEFAALNFTNPVDIEYAYKINNSEWYQIGNTRKLTFTNLSPGKYTITVRSTNSTGAWMLNEKSIDITILPPFWKSSFAYLAYILIAGLILYLIFKAFSKRQKQKQQYKMDLFMLHKEKELYQSKMEFFTNITHEIKTPLTLIKLPLEKISNSIHELPKFKKYIQIMNNNADRLFELTNQLLDFRKIETEHYKLSLTETDITYLVNETWNRFLPIIEQKNIHYELIQSPFPILMMADKDAILKIISNLLGNAIKYCYSEIYLKVIKMDSENTLEIIVANDGPLIPLDLRDEIFNPFVRAGKSKASGTGIGLTLAKSLAELHQGSITYHSENNFNTFVFALPKH